MSDCEHAYFIVRPGALGDSILLAPVLAQIRRSFPCRIILIGYPERLGPLKDAGLADRIASLDSWLHAPLQVLESGLENPGQARAESFFGKSGIHSFFPGIPADMPRGIKVFRHRPYPKPESKKHIVRHLSECLEIGMEIRPISCLKNLNKGIPRGFSERFLLIHPGAGSPSKRWPLERFLAVGGFCNERLPTHTVLFVLGEVEDGLKKPIERAGFPVILCESVRQLITVMRRADLYLGNDSGPTHLAALMGIPTVALFLGNSDPVVWKPWGEKVRVIQAATGGGPSAEEVSAAIEEISSEDSG